MLAKYWYSVRSDWPATSATSCTVSDSPLVRSSTVAAARISWLPRSIERTRALYRYADTGIGFLPERSARCIRAARSLYSQILDQIEAQDHDVFRARARVPTWRKVTTAGRALLLGR